MPIVTALILISFIQSSLLPFNLVFLIIIARSFITGDETNYFLAFGFGILLSLLSGLPLSSLSLVYLIAVAAVFAVKRAQFASHWAVILPLSAILLLLDHGARSAVTGSSLSPLSLLIQAILGLPVYFLVRLWEERFIPRGEIKLKVGK